jgi:16S rRNA (cytosine1402-N4)-methyltransferase
LRIAVNGELDNLRIALEELPALLEPGGGLCVISYHSLEDRIVKHAFRALYKKGFTKLFDKPLTPGREEIWSNRRARSAKLREAHAPASCDDTIPF